jgi:ParB family chromosome partitioning protein
MATKRTGLGRGIGALIPTADDANRATRPVDVFFPDVDSTPATAIAAVEQAAATEGLLTVPGARLARLSPDDIVPNAQQPRTVFDAEDLEELVHSVREFGVLQPIVVRPHPGEPGKYELVMGERRLRATKALIVSRPSDGGQSMNT